VLAPSLAQPAPEDILERLEQQRQRESPNAGSEQGDNRARLREATPCSVCTGSTTETTQCPRCLPGRPAVHKMCEDEWLLRNKICIFCRLPVRHTASKASAAVGSGGAVLSAHGAIFAYRSPRNKSLSAKLAALRKETNVGIDARADMGERERQAATKAEKEAARLAHSSCRPGMAAGVGRHKAGSTRLRKSPGSAVKLSCAVAKAKLRALYNTYRGGSAQYALDDVSLAAMLHFASQVALNSWGGVGGCHVVCACAPALPCRSPGSRISIFIPGGRRTLRWTHPNLTST
jgi:hypothetical protein